MKGAARLAKITEKSVDGALKRAVERGLSWCAIVELKNIGCDQKAISKGCRYATILPDFKSDAVIDVMERLLLEAFLVFNKLHIKKHNNKKVDKVPKAESQLNRAFLK